MLAAFSREFRRRFSHARVRDRMNARMSAIGPKQTWAVAMHMSAFGSKADIFPRILSLYGAHRRSVARTKDGRHLVEGLVASRIELPGDQ